MKIKFFIPDSLDKNLKATVHKSGKMGFTIEAAKKMGLGVEKGLSIGINEEDQEDKNLYVLVDEKKKIENFPILKAGNYFYINTKPLFDSMKIDYVNNYIAYDISKEDFEKESMFVLKRKEKERIKK